MTHYAFRDRGQDLDLEVDWVVVGSGAGGATAAVVLARNGQRVALVEAGAWRDPSDYPSSQYGAFRDLMPEFGAAVTVGRTNWPIVQGRTVGGSTVVNSAICVRTPGDVFGRWQRETGVGQDLEGRVGAIQDQLEAELCAADTPDDVAGRSNRLAMDASRALGFPSAPTKRYVKGCTGSGQCLQACRGGRKQSLNLNFVPELRHRDGVVVSCAPVDRVLFEGTRAVGVSGWFDHPRTHAWGAAFRIRAKRGVFMAASPMRSPLILRRSGLRLRELGRGFRAHPGTGVFGWYDDPVDMNVGATQGWASTAFRDEPGFKLETLAIPPELVASRLKGGGATLTERMASYRHLAMWVMAVRAETVGRVFRSPFGPMLSYTLDDADMRRMRTAAALLARAHFAVGARWVLPGVQGLPWRIGPDEVHLIEAAPLKPNAWIGVLSHLFGGCTMGADPQRSVCDAQGRVHGTEGLVIADASQIPSNLGVNPQHTIMALAWIRAEQALA